MIYISAGHNPLGKNPDPGAIGAKGVHEADLTVQLRNLIVAELLRIKGASFTVDNDMERLADYLKRIRPGSGSVVCEVHFNASESERATGAEVLVRDGASDHEKAMASEIVAAIVNRSGISNRGVKSEKESHRGRLGVLHTGAGLSCLPEICFISNPNDLSAYRKNMQPIALDIANILVKYDNLFQ